MMTAIQCSVSIVVSIPACHVGDLGSIPRRSGWEALRKHSQISNIFWAATLFVSAFYLLPLQTVRWPQFHTSQVPIFRLQGIWGDLVTRGVLGIWATRLFGRSKRRLRQGSCHLQVEDCESVFSVELQTLGEAICWLWKSWKYQCGVGRYAEYVTINKNMHNTSLYLL